MARVDEELGRLGEMSSATLRARWSALTGTPVPRISPAMLRLALAWENQSRAHGGLPRSVSQRLEQLAGADRRR